ncbi:uncharacterized protein LOC111988377 [Quercus suber]|uniref:uncharacterized protein LOC111988377 n=1 Tax=Quercus suber TaxID=58331 RepID=UPI000CE2672D|nr:uncharacterized protein LOC111988377 [Quercus suber]
MPERLSRQILWVSDLIDEDSKEWKRELVNLRFLPQDTDAILGIPLSVIGARNRVVWAETKNGRNEARHSGKQRSGLAVSRSSLRLLEQFQIANEHPATTAVQNQLVKWTLPPSGCYKVNVDGAVFSKRKLAAMGVVIRDEEGQLIATLCRKLYTPLGPLETEAKTMEVGIMFAREVGIRDVLFEGDSLVLNNAIHGLNKIDPSVQNVVKGILQSVQGFRTFAFSHTKRQGNAPAHALAQHVVNVEDFLVWLEECPGCIVRACMQDVRSIYNHE